jgi:uncharacterized membrane protein
MNKKEFLAQLKAELGNYDKEQVDELLGDYEAHFIEGISEKRKESEIAEKLGDPKVIAREYKTALLVKKAEASPTTSNVLRALFAFVGLGFFNVVFIFGPFVGALGLFFGMFVAGIAITFSGIMGMVAAFVWPYVQQVNLFINPVATFFISLSSVCFGSLLSIAVFVLTKWFLKITLQYIKFNLSIISGAN